MASIGVTFMIHHGSVDANNLARSKRSYDAVLPIVGIAPLSDDESGVGYACSTFHFSMQVPVDGSTATVGSGSHIAFAFENRDVVDLFHAVALGNGGTDDCAPGRK